MRRITIEPDRWECSLAECPPGVFVFDKRLAVKTENGKAFYVTGENFSGGANTNAEREQLMVQPVRVVWGEE